MNAFAGTDYRPDSKIVADGLVARLKSGASEDACLTIVEGRWWEWRADPKMRQHFNPETLFREKNFDKYLNAARMNQNSSPAGGFVG